MSKKASHTPTTTGRKILPLLPTDLARAKGCSKVTVSKLCKTRFRVAALGDGTYDSAHPVIAEWLAAPKREPRVKGSHVPKWVPFKQFMAENNLTPEQLADMLETLPAEAIAVEVDDNG